MPGHVVVLSERHLRHLLLSYMKYYNGPARIYPWRKMRRSRAPSIAPGIFFVAQSWADCIANMPGFNFTTGTTDAARRDERQRTTSRATIREHESMNNPVEPRRNGSSPHPSPG